MWWWFQIWLCNVCVVFCMFCVALCLSCAISTTAFPELVWTNFEPVVFRQPKHRLSYRKKKIMCSMVAPTLCQTRTKTWDVTKMASMNMNMQWIAQMLSCNDGLISKPCWSLPLLLCLLLAFLLFIFSPACSAAEVETYTELYSDVMMCLSSPWKNRTSSQVVCYWTYSKPALAPYMSNISSSEVRNMSVCALVTPCYH